MIRVFAATAACLLISVATQAADITAHARPRPPELVSENNTISGPLKDVLDEATQSVGLSVAWIDVPFARSLKELQDKGAVIVPRVRKTPDREQFVTFLGPISEQKRHVNFVVAKGNEGKVTSYQSLSTLEVGTKRGSLYFDQFDTDTKLKKNVVGDDNLLVKMLQAGHVDAIITGDLAATEAALKNIGWTGFAVAPYHEDIVSGNFYGIAKDGPLQAKADALNAALKKMSDSGRVKAIYQKYNLDPAEIKE
jgi:polar amino acid transport system substrate-binding protein